MSELSERISKAFEATGLKKVRIAEKLGVTSAAITQLCSGKNQPSSALLFSIETKLGIREEWIKTGEGEMFVSKSRKDEIAELAAKLYGADENSIEYRTMMYLKDMPVEDWKAFERFLNGVVKNFDA